MIVLLMNTSSRKRLMIITISVPERNSHSKRNRSKFQKLSLLSWASECETGKIGLLKLNLDSFFLHLSESCFIVFSSSMMIPSHSRVEGSIARHNWDECLWNWKLSLYDFDMVIRMSGVLIFRVEETFLDSKFASYSTKSEWFWNEIFFLETKKISFTIERTSGHEITRNFLKSQRKLVISMSRNWIKFRFWISRGISTRWLECFKLTCDSLKILLSHRTSSQLILKFSNGWESWEKTIKQFISNFSCFRNEVERGIVDCRHIEEFRNIQWELFFLPFLSTKNRTKKVKSEKSFFLFQHSTMIRSD